MSIYKKYSLISSKEFPYFIIETHIARQPTFTVHYFVICKLEVVYATNAVAHKGLPESGEDCSFKFCLVSSAATQ